VFLIWAVPPAALIAIGVWFYQYGSLQSKDPDYPEAKTAMKTSLWVWLGALLVQIVAMVVLIGSIAQRFR
jgi:H+/Cl- antiporter ClcA